MVENNKIKLKLARRENDVIIIQVVKTSRDALLSAITISLRDRWNCERRKIAEIK